MASDDRQEHPRGPVHLGTLTYPAHKFTPEYLLNFTELKGFQDDWDNLGLDIEEDLGGMQVEIMIDPTAGHAFPNSGGLRRLRFRPLSWDQPISSAVSIYYVHFQEFGHVLLILACLESDDHPLSRDERHSIRLLIDEERQILTRTHFPRHG